MRNLQKLNEAVITVDSRYKIPWGHRLTTPTSLAAPKQHRTTIPAFDSYIIILYKCVCDADSPQAQTKPTNSDVPGRDCGLGAVKAQAGDTSNTAAMATELTFTMFVVV